MIKHLLLSTWKLLLCNGSACISLFRNTSVKRHRLHEKTFWIQQCPLHHCGSLLLMVTPLHMSQKILPSARYTLSKLSEISGLSLLCATLGYQSSFIFGLSWVWLFLVLLSFSREILGKCLHYYHDGVLPLLVLWGVTLYIWLISGVPLFEENNCLLIKGSRVREKWLFFGLFDL